MESRFDRFNYYVRELALTLNQLCLIEVVVVMFFSYMAYDLLEWYKGIMTIDKFNAVAYWAAISGLVATIFTAVKSINDTHKSNNK